MSLRNGDYIITVRTINDSSPSILKVKVRGCELEGRRKKFCIRLYLSKVLVRGPFT